MAQSRHSERTANLFPRGGRPLLIIEIYQPTFSVEPIWIICNFYVILQNYRDVAQLVAHYVRDVGVACSSHVISTYVLWQFHEGAAVFFGTISAKAVKAL